MITLIATGHTETGLCNSVELHKIILQFTPDVIFEETPINKFAPHHLNSISNSIETRAIKIYLQTNSIDNFAVDMVRDDITEELFINDFRLMSHIFKHHSLEYKELSDLWMHQAGQYGFPYLNSQKCSDLLERKRLVAKEIVQSLNHEFLTKRHTDWSNNVNERENEMINNIYNHYKQKKYEKALFLVGAEHRKPIMDKIPEFEKNNNMHLNWNFNYFD